jgi:multisubunit Na+/H+ antiporter MnhE subunit
MARGGARAALGLMILWLGLAAVWLLYATTVDPPELVAGLVAGAFGVAAVLVVRRQRLVRFSLMWAWLLPAWRLPARVVVDTWRVLAAVVSRLRGRTVAGRFRTEPFPGGRGGRDTSRRVLATAGRSLPPGTYVVGFDEDDDLVLVHEFPGPVQ